MSQSLLFHASTTAPLFTPYNIPRTDTLSSDAACARLITLHNRLTDREERRQNHALLQRIESLSDLEPNLYARMSLNPDSMAYWLPELRTAVSHTTQTNFEIPSTQIHRLPPEIAQYIRVEYRDTDETSRAAFNTYLHHVFDIEDAHPMFIKTGAFSDKFCGHNVICREPEQIGDYFHAINNKAMILGAGRSIDLVVREYIDPVPNTPTIYTGLPLRCEFRSFIDFSQENPRILGLVPYWHPDVLKKHFRAAAELGIAQACDDERTFRATEPELNARTRELTPVILSELERLLPALANTRLPMLEQQWSLDIMTTGDRLHLIDMAPMADSALVDMLYNVHDYATVDPAEIRRLKGEPNIDFNHGQDCVIKPGQTWLDGHVRSNAIAANFMLTQW